MAELAKVREEAKDGGDTPKMGFVSRKQLREIINKFSALAPKIDTGRQRFDITSNSRANVPNLDFGSTLADTLRTPGYAHTPDDIGVAGIPSTVIGFGDGLMMQILSMMDQDRTLKIFDGVHLPLDAIKNGSRMANQAVYETWQGNPLRHVLDSYQEFLKAYSLDDVSEEMNKALTRALIGFDPKQRTTDIAEIRYEIERLGRDLQAMADGVTARHNALSRVVMTVDQMASASSPYVSDGEIDLSNEGGETEILRRLNDLLEEEKGKLAEAKEAAQEPSEEISKELERAGHKHPSGARVVGYHAQHPGRTEGSAEGDRSHPDHQGISDRLWFGRRAQGLCCQPVGRVAPGCSEQEQGFRVDRSEDDLPAEPELRDVAPRAHPCCDLR